MNDNFDNRIKEYKDLTAHALDVSVPIFVKLELCEYEYALKYLEKPYDETFTKVMNYTMKYMCKEIKNCVFGFCHENKITIIIKNDTPSDISAFGESDLQSIVSFCAAKATFAFNSLLKCLGTTDNYVKIAYRIPYFEAKAWNVDPENVTYAIYLTQCDNLNNSIEYLAKYYMDEMLDKNSALTKEDVTKQIQDFIESVPQCDRVGYSCIKNAEGKWVIDKTMPILRKENRRYLESLINFV